MPQSIHLVRSGVRAVANVKNVDCSVAFVDGADDRVDVWLTQKADGEVSYFLE
jgi:hypothetical protein